MLIFFDCFQHAVKGRMYRKLAANRPDIGAPIESRGTEAAIDHGMSAGSTIAVSSM